MCSRGESVSRRFSVGRLCHSFRRECRSESLVKRVGRAGWDGVAEVGEVHLSRSIKWFLLGGYWHWAGHYGIFVPRGQECNGALSVGCEVRWLAVLDRIGAVG